MQREFPGWNAKQEVKRSIVDVKAAAGAAPTTFQRALLWALNQLLDDDVVTRAAMARAVPDVNTRDVQAVFERVASIATVLCVNVRRRGGISLAYVLASSAASVAAQAAYDRQDEDADMVSDRTSFCGRACDCSLTERRAREAG